MNKRIKTMLPVIFSAALLTACGDVFLEINDPPSHSSADKGSYTVVSPNEGGEVPDIDISEKSIERSEVNIYTEDNAPSGDTISEMENELFVEEGDEPVFIEDDGSEPGTVAPVQTDTAGMTGPDISPTVIIYSKPADVSRRAKQIVSEMTDEEKIGQLILARCPGSDAAETMSQYQFGGYVFFAGDFQDRDRDSAAAFISGITDSADITPFLAVDEEGGEIVRVSKFYRDTPFSSPGEIYSEGGTDALYDDASEKADLLLSLGLNMNLAPVADVASPGDYIYPRTIADDYSAAGEGAVSIINASGRKGLMSCVKHFPGYGSNVDTHTGIAHDNRSLEYFRNNDFIPFEMAIAADYTPAVMVNHNIIESVDGGLPASLSPAVHKILRSELGFDGVIITDDLSMNAVNAYSGSISPYVMGIFAGNDLLCVSSPVAAYNDLLDAVNNGYIKTNILDQHVQRIIQMKLDYGLIS